MQPAEFSYPHRIVGIDPGLRRTGFGVIENAGDVLRYIASGCIDTDAEQPLARRLADIYSGVNTVVQTYQPQSAAVEIVFVNINPQSTLLLGQARGAAISALACTLQNVHEYTALQLKKSIVGYGRASKPQIQEMVTRLLHLSKTPPSDAADALALAITHAHAQKSFYHLQDSHVALPSGSFWRRRKKIA